LCAAAAGHLGRRAAAASAHTRHAFYGRDDGTNRLLTEAGVVAAAQECATIFVVGSLRRVKVGAILGTDSNIFLDPQPAREEKERLYQQVERDTIAIAIDAVDRLHGAR